MSDSSKQQALTEQHDELLDAMERKRQEWAADGEDKDDTDKLLDEAIAMAVAQGKGWAPGEKEEYISKILDDDYIPPIFAETQEELEQSGLAEAFSALQYDDSPAIVMLDFKKKGTDAFLNGKRNVNNNVQFFRDAINHYYEAFAWAQKIESTEVQAQYLKDTKEGFASSKTSDEKKEASATEAPEYSEKELDEMKSNLLNNAALAHMQLKNWGHVRDDATKALEFNKENVKAWYRLAKAQQMLKHWEQAGDAIDSGLACPGESENKDLLKLSKLIEDKVRTARLARQKRERRRAERVSNVKAVWKHCKENNIKLGRVPLVATVTDDDEEGDDVDESRWHHHHPHTGQLPSPIDNGSGNDWSWPCMFVYPSHSQSDFVQHLGESEMLAIRIAQMFPELEEGDETDLPWDFQNEFQCSNLAIYFEINCTEKPGEVVHPDSVERLTDQGSTMRFYEAARALKGDEGEDMVALATAVERKRLHKQRKAWKKKHGSLWAKPDPSNVVRVHPAMTLKDVLTDERMVVANVSGLLLSICTAHLPCNANLLTFNFLLLFQFKLF